MIYGSAGVVDSVCHLNGWGRCSIPIHALEVNKADSCPTALISSFERNLLLKKTINPEVWDSATICPHCNSVSVYVQACLKGGSLDGDIW